MGAEGGIRIYDHDILDKLNLWHYVEFYQEVRQQTIFHRRVVTIYYGDNMYPYSGWTGGAHTYGCQIGREQCQCKITAPYTEEQAEEALKPAFIDDWEVWT